MSQLLNKINSFVDISFIKKEIRQGKELKMLNQREIARLIRIRKYVQERIIWRSRAANRKIERFKVKVLSIDLDPLEFSGQYNTELNELSSLVLIYQNRPLVRIDKFQGHKNPEDRGGEVFNDWHKHEQDEIWEDHVARDVTHEFNDAMSREDFIDQFMEENNMDYIRDIKVQTTVINWKEKINKLKN